VTTDPGLYARSFADVYDDWYANLDDPALLVSAFQQRLPSTATVVEFGSGTGRLAMPLRHTGFEVFAIDVSESMLRAAWTDVPSVAADIAHVALKENCADAVLIAYNTLFNLEHRTLQERCFAEAARILRPGGLLVVEAFVLPPGDGAVTDPSNHDRGIGYGISVREHPTEGDAMLVIMTGPPGFPTASPDLIVGSHIELLANATICRPWQLAYQNPQALDAAALRVRLRLTERCADWSGSAFDDNSGRHVSWYQHF